MPNGVFPVPEFRPTPTRAGGTRPSLATRWRLRWRAAASTNSSRATQTQLRAPSSACAPRSFAPVRSARDSPTPSLRP